MKLEPYFKLTGKLRWLEEGVLMDWRSLNGPPEIVVAHQGKCVAVYEVVDVQREPEREILRVKPLLSKAAKKWEALK